jgi:hypothetical protein
VRVPQDERQKSFILKLGNLTPFSGPTVFSLELPLHSIQIDFRNAWIDSRAEHLN